VSALWPYGFVLATLLLTCYGQLAIRAGAVRLAHIGAAHGQVAYMVAMLSDPAVLSGLFAAVLAAVAWILAVRQLPLTHAYPFMALAFVLVPVAAAFLFGDALRPIQLAGMASIALGVVLTAAGR
jgi:drug/metabolite transporter (DMT)-like permease